MHSARLSADEVHVGLLVFVVEGVEDVPEPLDEVIFVATVLVVSVLLEHFLALISVILLLMILLTEKHQVVPGEEGSEVAHVTEGSLDTNPNVMHLLVSLSDELVADRILVVSEVRTGNDVFFMAWNRHSLVCRVDPSPWFILGPVATVLHLLAEHSKALVETSIFSGEVFHLGTLVILSQHPESGSHWHAEVQVISEEETTDLGADELVALHQLSLSHLWVDVEAVALGRHVQPSIWCLDEERQLITHQLSFDSTLNTLFGTFES